jgi:hypothetical protein
LLLVNICHLLSFVSYFREIMPKRQTAYYLVLGAAALVKKEIGRGLFGLDFKTVHA